MSQSDPKKSEPQSYGSQKEWLTGRTGGTINDTAPSIYDSRVTTDESPGALGGLVSQVQQEASAQPQGPEQEDRTSDATGVTTNPEGAKRGSFFKNRDYQT